LPVGQATQHATRGIQDSEEIQMSMRKIGLLVTVVAGFAMLCVACGNSAHVLGGGTRSAPISTSRTSGTSGISGTLSAAEQHTCLVTQAEATAGLGLAVTGEKELYQGVCTYLQADSIAPVLIVNIFPEPFAVHNPYIMGKPVPVSGVGHQAVCGPGLALPFNLVGAIDSAHTLDIEGPSCSVDRQFALEAYSRL
jgi:hypothetical protein